MFKELMAPYVSPLHPLPTAVESKINLHSSVCAVMFDIYGTLFISASGDISIAKRNDRSENQLKALFKKYHHSQSISETKDKLFHAIETDHAKKKHNGTDFPEVTIEHIWMQVLDTSDSETARRFAIEYEMIVNPVYPMPHLHKTLQALKKKNLTMGIISNAQFFTPYLFNYFCGSFPEHLGFDRELIFYSHEYVYAKPSQVLFEKAAQQLLMKGIQPAQALYVGNDMLNDMYPAHQIGFQTCLFAGDARSLRLRQDDSRCESLIPDAIIKELNQLTNMIRSG